MIPLSVTMNIDDEPWRDLDGSPHGMLTRLCGIPNGTLSKRPDVGLAITLDDGTTIIAETTLLLLVNAVRALEIKYKGQLL